MANTADLMNKFFEPVMFQVVGSTPAGVKDALKKAGLKGATRAGVQLATIAVFAACVNKATLQNFIAKDEFVEARPIIMNAISISGNANMTALTLLGHCLMTTNMLDKVQFVVEFRKKMGQNNIWEGSLDAGSLSDKQKGIMKEKVRVTPIEQAKLLGSGFWKYAGVDREGFTHAEAEFWGEASTTTRQGRDLTSGTRDLSSQRLAVDRPSPPRNVAPMNRRQASHSETVGIDLTETERVQINKEAMDYYLAVNGGDTEAMKNSIRNRGADGFNAVYLMMSSKDPERRGTGSSVVA